MLLDEDDELARSCHFRQLFPSAVPKLDGDALAVNDNAANLRPCPATRSRQSERKQIPGLYPLVAYQDSPHVRAQDGGNGTAEDNGRERTGRNGTMTITDDDP